MRKPNDYVGKTVKVYQPQDRIPVERKLHIDSKGFFIRLNNKRVSLKPSVNEFGESVGAFRKIPPPRKREMER